MHKNELLFNWKIAKIAKRFAPSKYNIHPFTIFEGQGIKVKK